MKTNLYMWNGIINGDQCTIYALAESLEAAKLIACERAPFNVEADVKRIVEKNGAAVLDKPTSFIMLAGAQLT